MTKYETHTFDFLDGECPSKPAPRIDDFFSGPYLAYYVSHRPPAIRAAHDFLAAIIAERGPFDGIIAFSQGAALAASYLLTHDALNPSAALPFKLAVFCGCVMPLSPSSHIGQDVTETVRDTEYSDADCLRPMTDEEKARLHVQVRELGKEEQDDDWRQDERQIGVYLNGTGTTCLSDQRVFGFLPGAGTHGARIKIPTAHIFGATDQWREHSAATLQLCTGVSVRSFVHGGGHDVPRAGDDPRRLRPHCARADGRCSGRKGARVFRHDMHNTCDLVIACSSVFVQSRLSASDVWKGSS